MIEADGVREAFLASSQRVGTLDPIGRWGNAMGHFDALFLEGFKPVRGSFEVSMVVFAYLI